jgi:hypothetical protein
LTLPLAAILALTGCRLDSVDNGQPDSGGNATITPPPASGGNRAPTISGTPPGSATVDTLYDFTPQASDPDGDTLRFEITGRPAWATFNPNTGRLYGTPSSSGSFGNIVISVTDGPARAVLPEFSIQVAEVVPVIGSAKLSWIAPTTNTDGSPLTELAGFRIYYGRQRDTLSERLEIADPAAQSTVVQGLSSGTWYFSISAVTRTGVESDRSAVVSKTI